MSAPIDQLSVVWVNMNKENDTDWEEISELLNKSKLGKGHHINTSQL